MNSRIITTALTLFGLLFVAQDAKAAGPAIPEAMHHVNRLCHQAEQLECFVKEQFSCSCLFPQIRREVTRVRDFAYSAKAVVINGPSKKVLRGELNQLAASRTRLDQLICKAERLAAQGRDRVRGCTKRIHAKLDGMCQTIDVTRAALNCRGHVNVHPVPVHPPIPAPVIVEKQVVLRIPHRTVQPLPTCGDRVGYPRHQRSRLDVQHISLKRLGKGVVSTELNFSIGR